MKKLFLLVSLMLSQASFAFGPSFDMNYWEKLNYSSRANSWFNTHVRFKPYDYHRLLAEYCACRVQEIKAWLELERTDLNRFQNKIARIQHWDALQRKRAIESKVRGAYSALQALRNEARHVANEKFTAELLSSCVNYKSGKRAAAKIAKLSFYTYCWDLLVK